RARPQSLGGVQRDGRGSDAESLPADRRERHGLDVRQLLDDGPARRPGLVPPVPRRRQAALREAVREGEDRRGNETGAGRQQPAGLPPAAREGTEGDRGERNVAGRSGSPLPAPGTLQVRIAGQEPRVPPPSPEQRGGARRKRKRRTPLRSNGLFFCLAPPLRFGEGV